MSEIDVSKCKYYMKYYDEVIDETPVVVPPYNLRHENYCLIHKKDCSYSDCYFKQLQQLKQENEELKQKNEELRSDNSMLLAQGDANAFVVSNLNFKIQKLQQCLDKIEDIIEECKTNDGCYDTCKYYDSCNCDMDSFVLQLIKQAKEGK